MKHIHYCTFEDEIENAQNAIDDYATVLNRLWLQELLDILKERRNATVHFKNGDLCDVESIANVGDKMIYDYVSFADVFNNLYGFDTNIKPIVTDELKNRYLRCDLYMKLDEILEKIN